MDMLVRICVTGRYGNGKTSAIDLTRQVRNPKLTLGNMDEIELKNKIRNKLITDKNFKRIKEVVFTHEVVDDNNIADSYLKVESYMVSDYDSRDQILETLINKMYNCFNISNEIITKGCIEV